MATGRGESYWDDLAYQQEVQRMEEEAWAKTGLQKLPSRSTGVNNEDAGSGLGSFEFTNDTQNKWVSTDPNSQYYQEPGGNSIDINGKQYIQADRSFDQLSQQYGSLVQKSGLTANDFLEHPQYGTLMTKDSREAFGKAFGDAKQGSLSELMSSFASTIGVGLGFTGAMGALGFAGGGASAFGAEAGALSTGAGGAAGNLAGLTQMAADAGLTGAAADAFIASGGAMGSTAGGGAMLNSAPWGVGEQVSAADPGYSMGQDLYNENNPFVSDLTSLGSGGQAAGQSGMEQTLAPNFPGMTSATSEQVGGGLSPFDSIASGVGLGVGATGVLTAAQLAAGNAEDAARDMEGSSQGPGADPSQLNAAGTAANGPWSRLINGTATPDDYARLFGPLAAGGLGAIGATQQADAYRDVADKYFGMGQPHRDRLNASYAPGFSMANEPGYQGAMDQSAQSVLRGLSTKGNPFDNPGVLAEAQKYVTNTTALPQLNTYRSQLGTFGQLGVNTAGTAEMQGANTSGGALNAIGYGLSNALAPKDDLTALLNKTGFGLNTKGWGY